VTRSSKRAIAPVLIAAALVALLAGCGSSGSSATTTTSASGAPVASAQGVPRLGHVFVIVGENTSLSQITPAHAPYLANTLKPRAAWLANYHSLRHTASLGDYVGMTSGQFTKCEANDALPIHCHQTVPNLFSQLDRVQIPWEAWNESADNACDFVDHGAAWAKNTFSAHHQPAIYYTNVEGGKYDESITPTPECLHRDLAMGSTGPNDTAAFDQAVAAGSVGDFNLVIPNDCENGHDPCGTHDPVKQFDDFLAREVPKIEASPAFGSNGLILITWDEGADPPLNPTHPLALAIGPQVQPGVYGSQRFDHYGLLRTIEDGYGLSHLAAAKQAHSISGIWR